MRTRKQIKKRANKILSLRKQLLDELNELQKEDYLLCDKTQWFTEKEETTGRGKKKETRLVGRVHWFDYFLDADNNDKPIKFERSSVVRINGVWIF